MPLSYGVPEHLQREVLGAEFRKHFDGTLRSDEAIEPFDTPTALLAFLHGRTKEYARKDAALCALLRAFQAGGPSRAGVGALLLLAMWPGLTAVARSKRRRGRDPEEVWAEVHWAFLETAWRYPLDRRPARVAQNLKFDTLHRLGDAERGRTREAETAARLVREAERDGGKGLASASLDPALIAEEAEAARKAKAFREVLVRACDRAVAEGLISDLDRNLIVATRLYGRDLRTLARDRGLAYEMARKRRQRAEAVVRRLVDPGDLP